MDFYNAGFVLGMVEAQLSSHWKIPTGEGLERKQQTSEMPRTAEEALAARLERLAG